MTIWVEGESYGHMSRDIVDKISGRAICRVWRWQWSIGDHDGKTWPEGEANFTLILQAPVLLEALEAIRDQAECYLQPLRAVGVSRARWKKVRDRAVTAIAAVKGENDGNIS